MIKLRMKFGPTLTLPSGEGTKMLFGGIKVLPLGEDLGGAKNNEIVLRQKIKCRAIFVSISFALLNLISISSHAQDKACNGLPGDKPGVINVYAEPYLNELAFAKMRAKNPEKETEFPGYRVQIFFGSDRAGSNKA